MKKVATFGLLLALTTFAAGARQLHQASPNLTVPAALQVSGVTLSFPWRAVGTRNYTATPGSAYGNQLGIARFFKESGAPQVGELFFDVNSKQAFTKIDPTSGATTGLISATVIKSDPSAANQQNDGGVGSINNVLYRVDSATGTLANITFVIRINSLGGNVPPNLKGINGFTSDIPAAGVAVPYMADYLFFVNGTASTPPPSSSSPPPSGSGQQNPCFCQNSNGSVFCFNFAGSGVNNQCNPTGGSNCQASTATAGQFSSQGGSVWKCNAPASG